MPHYRLSAALMLPFLLGTAEPATQDAAAPATPASSQTAAAPAILQPAPQPKCTAGTIPALTPVSLQVLDELGSKLSHTGQTFAIRLAAPIELPGCEAIPAGATGLGEVIHAKKNGGSGTPGELVLAARYLDFGARQLKLRSMHLSVVGKDSYDAAFAVGVTIGIPALFMSGKNVVVAPGSSAVAKTSEDFDLVPAQPSAAPSEPAAMPSPQTIQPSTTTPDATGGSSNAP